MNSLHRRVLLTAKRAPHFRRTYREVCWLCKGLCVVNIPDPRVDLRVAQERCLNCSGRGYIVREA